MHVAECYVVRARDDGRMIKNNTYGELTRSLVHAKKFTDKATADQRCNEQNQIVNNPTITTNLRGLTFEVKTLRLTLIED